MNAAKGVGQETIMQGEGKRSKKILCSTLHWPGRSWRPVRAPAFAEQQSTAAQTRQRSGITLYPSRTAPVFEWRRLG